jgi:hypothetical protein
MFPFLPSQNIKPGKPKPIPQKPDLVDAAAGLINGDNSQAGNHVHLSPHFVFIL